jgi:hypothetical protein
VCSRPRSSTTLADPVPVEGRIGNVCLDHQSPSLLPLSSPWWARRDENGRGMNPPRNAQGVFLAHVEPVVSSIETGEIIADPGAAVRHNLHGVTRMRAASRARRVVAGRRSVPAADPGPVSQPGRAIKSATLFPFANGRTGANHCTRVKSIMPAIAAHARQVRGTPHRTSRSKEPRDPPRMRHSSRNRPTTSSVSSSM